MTNYNIDDDDIEPDFPEQPGPDQPARPQPPKRQPGKGRHSTKRETRLVARELLLAHVRRGDKKVNLEAIIATARQFVKLVG